MLVNPIIAKFGIPAVTLSVGFGLSLSLFTSMQPSPAYTEELFMMRDAQGAALLTTSEEEVEAATEEGYEVAQTYAVPVSGETEVHDLYNEETEDQLTVPNTGNAVATLTSTGEYRDRGVRFRAATSETSFYSTPVYRYEHRGRHTYATPDETQSLESAGWEPEQVEFWVHEETTNSAVALETSEAIADAVAVSTPASEEENAEAQASEPAEESTEEAVVADPEETSTESEQKETAADDAAESDAVVVNTSGIGAGSVTASEIDYDNAIFVAPASSSRTADAKLGSQENPYETVSAAIKAAPKYSTVVVRAGTYHESLTLENKYLNIVGYPGEQVIFDAAETFDDWTKTGSVWATGWEYDFSHDVTFTAGAANGTSYSVNWLDDDAPYAYLPEQVWIDGQAQEQVGSKSELAAGKFYVDNSSNQLYLGSDPTGHKVTISTLQRAFMVWNGSVPKERLHIENLTFRNYSPSNPQLAAGLFYTQNYDLINTTFQNTSVSSVGVYADDVHLNGLTIENSGLLAVAANEVSGLVIENSVFTDFNTQRFSSAPVSGAIKITTSDHITISNNNISNTTANPKGKGIWLDESTQYATVENNTISNVEEDAIYAEVSDQITISNNTITDVPIDGIRIGNTSNATVTGNNVTAGERAFYAWQEDREPSASSYYAMDARDGIKPGSAGWAEYLANYMSWRIDHLVIEDNTFTATVSDTTRPAVGIMADTDSGVSLDGLAAIDSMQNNTINCTCQYEIAIAVAGARDPKIYDADFEVK